MKAKQFLIPIIVFIALAGLLFGGLFVYRKFIYKDTSYIGKWTRQVDVTDHVKNMMDLWLDSALVGDAAEYGDERVVLCVTMVMNADGSWSEYFDESSYAQAQIQAQTLAAGGLRSFLYKRLVSAEVDPGSVGKTVDELVQEAVGMSAEEYIAQYGPQLIPSVEDLKSAYGHSGNYNVKNGVLARTGLGTEATYEQYSVQDGFLLISAKSDKAEDIEIPNNEKPSLSISINETPATTEVTPDQILSNVAAPGVIYPLVYTRQ